MTDAAAVASALARMAEAWGPARLIVACAGVACAGVAPPPAASTAKGARTTPRSSPA